MRLESGIGRRMRRVHRLRMYSFRHIVMLTQRRYVTNPKLATPQQKLSFDSVGEVISLRLLSGPTRDPYCTVLGSLVYRDQYDSFLFFVLSCNLHSNRFNVAPTTRPYHIVVGGVHLVPVEQQPMAETVDFFARCFQPTPRFVLPQHCKVLPQHCKVLSAKTL